MLPLLSIVAFTPKCKKHFQVARHLSAINISCNFSSQYDTHLTHYQFTTETIA